LTNTLGWRFALLLCLLSSSRMLAQTGQTSGDRTQDTIAANSTKIVPACRPRTRAGIEDVAF